VDKRRGRRIKGGGRRIKEGGRRIKGGGRRIKEGGRRIKGGGRRIKGRTPMQKAKSRRNNKQKSYIKLKKQANSACFFNML